VTDWFARGLDVRFPSYPIGPLVAIVAQPDQVPPPDALFAMNVDAETRMSTPPDDAPADPQSWAGDLANDYARPWLVLARAYVRTGDMARAHACLARARARAPWAQ
jgi:hypothetical protein